MKSNEFPFKILVFGTFLFKGQTPSFAHPRNVTSDTLDDIIKMCRPETMIQGEGPLLPDRAIDLTFESFKDFHPDRIVQKHPFLKQFIALQSALKKSKDPSEYLQQRPDFKDIPLPASLTNKQLKKRSESTKVDQMLSMVTFENETENERKVDSLGEERWVENALSEMMDLIFSDHDFKCVEASWTGLRTLLKTIAHRKEKQISVEIYPVHKKDLSQTIKTLTPYLTEHIPSLIIVDLPFTHPIGDENEINALARFAENGLIPTLIELSPDFLFLRSWDKITELPYLPNHFEKSAYSKWNRLKKDPASLWIAATLNRFLIRFPYGKNNPTTLFSFEEPAPLWISPVWGVAQLISQSLMRTGAFSSVTRYESNHLEDLALSKTIFGQHCATMAHFSSDRLEQFHQCGLMPLIGKKNADMALLPKGITLKGENLSAQLFLSRITHYLIQLKDRTPLDTPPESIYNILYKGFKTLWESTGKMLPEGFHIEIMEQTDDGLYPVRLYLFPHRKESSERKHFDLEFLW